MNNDCIDFGRISDSEMTTLRRKLKKIYDDTMLMSKSFVHTVERALNGIFRTSNCNIAISEEEFEFMIPSEPNVKYVDGVKVYVCPNCGEKVGYFVDEQAVMRLAICTNCEKTIDWSKENEHDEIHNSVTTKN